MRFSLYRSACTSAVASVLIALPCMAQSAPKAPAINTTTSTFTVSCKDASHLVGCIDTQKSLSKQDQEKLKAMMPSLQTMARQGINAHHNASGKCLALKVYKFPRNYPETNAGAAPSITTCESASLFNEKTTVLQIKRAQH